MEPCLRRSATMRQAIGYRQRKARRDQTFREIRNGIAEQMGSPAWVTANTAVRDKQSVARRVARFAIAIRRRNPQRSKTRRLENERRRATHGLAAMFPPQHSGRSAKLARRRASVPRRQASTKKRSQRRPSVPIHVVVDYYRRSACSNAFCRWMQDFGGGHVRRSKSPAFNAVGRAGLSVTHRFGNSSAILRKNFAQTRRWPCGRRI